MRLALIWLLLVPVLAISEEGAVEIPQGEDKKLEWGGNLDVKYVLFHTARKSPTYRLQFSRTDALSPYLTQYRLEPYLNADYSTKNLGFHLKTHATYLSDEESSVDLFEAYGNFNPSFNTTIQAGKRVYNWGKGYAFNPSGYLNPYKDPENPELAQAGLLSASVEYVKSLSSDALRNFSLLSAVIPPAASINRRYAELNDTDLALKVYCLLWDADLDLMGYYSRANPKRIGMDFARNLQENLEVHGELSYDQDVRRHKIVNGGLRTEQQNGLSCLLGFRYLSRSSTTVIGEYYHSGIGLSRREYESYADFLASGADSESAGVAQEALEVSQKSFRGGFLMQNYLYVKVIQPEPFNWLYFTPSIYTIYNLGDKSLLLSASLAYKPVTNLEFVFWPTFLLGGTRTEFGGRPFQQKLELWMRVYF